MGVGDRDGERTRDLVERVRECATWKEGDKGKTEREIERKRRKKKVKKQRKTMNKNTKEDRLCLLGPNGQHLAILT